MVFVGLIASYYTIRYSSQPLLEAHGFRQTQTAITSYWMMKEGWQLDYQTPVVGYPWSIPFEFPIYQSIVAAISFALNSQPDPVGRITSFIFLLACLVPSLMIFKRLNFKKESAFVFCSILWSSPLYMFWGRSFLIETTALFLLMMAIAYSFNLTEKNPKFFNLFLFSIFSALALLQKVTTAAPTLLVLSFLILYNLIKTSGINKNSVIKLIRISFCFLIPFIISFIWTLYSDNVKSKNFFGAFLTSQHLSIWNIGTLKQHMDPSILKTIIWHRVFLNNASGFLGLGIIIFSVIVSNNNVKKLIILCLTLFFITIYSFINLHLEHDYYQVSCGFFLLAALSVSISVSLKDYFKKEVIVPFFTVIIVLTNLYSFRVNTEKILTEPLNPVQERIIKVGNLIKKMTPENSALVIYGYPWSSEFAYYSCRKSLTVNISLAENIDLWNNPENYVGNLKIGGIVFITNNPEYYINLDRIINRKDFQKSSNLFKIDNNCYVFIKKD